MFPVYKYNAVIDDSHPLMEPPPGLGLSHDGGVNLRLLGVSVLLVALAIFGAVRFASVDAGRVLRRMLGCWDAGSARARRPHRWRCCRREVEGALAWHRPNRYPSFASRGLSKRYGRAQVLQDVSFDVPAGSVVALLGANGAGKTTTLKCMLGVIPFDGAIDIAGISVRDHGKGRTTPHRLRAADARAQRRRHVRSRRSPSSPRSRGRRRAVCPNCSTS